MALNQGVSLRADLKELKEFASEAESAVVKKLLKGSIADLEKDLAHIELAEAKEKKEEEAKKAAAAAEAQKKKKAAESSDDDSSDEPAVKPPPPAKKKWATFAKAKQDDSDDDSEDEKPVLKKKAEAAKAEEKSEDKKEVHADPTTAPGEVVTPGGLTITAKANNALKKLKSGLGRKAKDTAAICKITKDGKTFELEEWLNGASIEDITDELHEMEPRYIFYSYSKVMPDGRLKTPLLFLYYSPQKAPPKKSMETTRWKNEVSKVFEIVKTFEVRDLEDFTQEWFDSIS
eukprot:Rhum_TRINITY_DN14494_c36_g1::Rhum_TRINITY_DN14494_c36_g1_i1::g.93061::m.93061